MWGHARSGPVQITHGLSADAISPKSARIDSNRFAGGRRPALYPGLRDIAVINHLAWAIISPDLVRDGGSEIGSTMARYPPARPFRPCGDQPGIRAAFRRACLVRHQHAQRHVLPTRTASAAHTLNPLPRAGTLPRWNPACTVSSRRNSHKMRSTICGVQQLPATFDTVSMNKGTKEGGFRNVCPSAEPTHHLLAMPGRQRSRE
jgi:hypothetical protein